MKRILSLALALMLLIGSAFLVSCDENTDTPAATTTAATTAEVTEDSSAESKPATPPAPVDSINGMTITQLYERFIDEYTAATTYDVTIDSSIKADGVNVKYRYEAKMSPDAYYIKIVSDEITMESWIVDGVMYVKSGEEKYKAPAVSEDGESLLGMVNELLGDAFSALDVDGYIKQIEELQLYSYRGEYYYEREMTEEECEALGVEGATEKVYFNAQGKVTKRVCTDGVSNISATIKYGQPVVIKAPADADSYIEDTEIGGDESALTKDECIEACSELLDTLESAEIFAYVMKLDGEEMLAYATDGRDEYVRVSSDEGKYEIWSVGGRGYISHNDSDQVQVPLDDNANSSFANAANLSGQLFPEIRSIFDDVYIARSTVYDDYMIIGLELNNDSSDGLYICAYNDMSYVEILMFSEEEQIAITYSNVGNSRFNVDTSYYV